MAVTKEFLDHVMDILGPLGTIRSRPMMGGHCLYCDGQVFALVDDDTLYLKVSAETRQAFVDAGLHAFAPDKNKPEQTMNYHAAPAEVFDEVDAVRHWGGLALAAGAKARVKKAANARGPAKVKAGKKSAAKKNGVRKGARRSA